ncbi:MULTISPECIES: ROK family protein [Paenibacillus]|uniref:ROK family protein n=1 Tax=Paenibacillus TaxID=44249 RepID=UPI001F238DB8|nr:MULTISPECIES: ROK family protein [Paenibacillus]
MTTDSRESHSPIYCAGLDIGGTKTLICLTDENGVIQTEHKLETKLSRDPRQFFLWLFVELDQLCRTYGSSLAALAGIGIGLPGVMNESTGILSSAPALNWPYEDIRAIISRYYTGVVVLDNDVNMAALGEQDAGAAAGAEHFMMITIGTGIGGALFLNGQLYRGARYSAGEIGYLNLGPVANESMGGHAGDKPEDSEFGPFELVVSGTGIGRQAAELVRDASADTLIRKLASGTVPEARHVFEAAMQGDAAAVSILNRAYDLMALTIKNMLITLDLELIVLGGGVVEKNAGYETEIAERVSRYTPRLSVPIRRAKLGNSAGAIGAAAAARSRLTATGRSPMTL